MYAVTVPVGDAPSQVARHDESFARQVCATHVAIDTQLESFGQLVGLVQQRVATHVAHDEPGLLKICAAPAQVPPSSDPTVPLSVELLPPSGCGAAPPPGAAAEQGTPSTGLQLPS
jgi:hypothetical protein